MVKKLVTIAFAVVMSLSVSVKAQDVVVKDVDVKEKEIEKIVGNLSQEELALVINELKSKDFAQSNNSKSKKLLRYITSGLGTAALVYMVYCTVKYTFPVDKLAQQKASLKKAYKEWQNNPNSPSLLDNLSRQKNLVDAMIALQNYKPNESSNELEDLHILYTTILNAIKKIEDPVKYCKDKEKK